MQTASSRRFTHILELDGLRGIAVLLVFYHHLCYTVPPAGWGQPFQFFYSTSAFGYNGVALFFVLSGFLITSLLLEASPKPNYYRNFYWKRALRILPLYAFCLIALAIALPGSRKYVLLCIFFLSNFASVFHVASWGPFWSLAVEEQFYLVWPTVVHHRSLPSIKRFAATLFAAVFILRLVSAAFGHHNYYLTWLCCDTLAAGAWIACWYRERKPQSESLNQEARILLTVFLVALVLIAPSFLPSTNPRIFAMLAASAASGTTLLFAATLAFIVAQQGSATLAILRSRVLQFFGLISYAMYMLHSYILNFYDFHHPALIPNDSMGYTRRAVIVLFFTLAFSLISRYAIELPAQSLRKHVLPPSARTFAADPLPITGVSSSTEAT